MTNEQHEVKSGKYKLVFKNYKEPITRVKKGFGYYGVMLTTNDGTKVQCHICGELFANLGFHIYYAHKIKGVDYKTSFGLAYKTALMSEVNKENLRRGTMDWLSAMTPKQLKEYRERQGKMHKNRVHDREQPKLMLETKNKRGTCPDQLLAKITEVKNKLRHTPSLSELIRETGGQKYKHLLYTTFGSYKNALKLLSLQPQTSAKKGVWVRKYTEEELIEYLRIFTQEHKRIPTSMDCKTSGFLPSEDTYMRHFGSLVIARDKAELQDVLSISLEDNEFQEKMMNYQLNK